ncbi:translation initiation factor eIF3 subunit-domain-containing protein [Parasitella parasitica]|nr:translation initiation factor eIF3 subunit-domain-containing protein [Parasitella parasitica]
MSLSYTHQRDSGAISGDAAPRFSVNSNLMNYSIPKNDDTSVSPTLESSTSRREIQRGDSDTQSRQLEAQIEHLTLQNVKLQRTNRLLKVDTDNLIEQKTSPLEKTIQELTIANVRLQRASRLLQLELDEKTEQLNKFQQNQILQMKTVGPEYEFLVQNINLLQRQIAGHPTCDDTCCFTMQPIDQSTMVMTLPCNDHDTDSDDNEEEGVEAQHICRPVIHSSISQGSYAVELENKILRLEQFIEELDEEKEQILRQHSYKDNDVETLKKELRIKDQIVSQLEQDFMGLEDQIEHLQKELQDQTMFNSGSSNASSHSNIRSLLTPPPIQSDPKRQSQMLMESKRRSLAIKDTDILEQMLRGDLEGFNQQQHHHHQTQRNSTIMVIEEHDDLKKGINEKLISCLTCDGFPCTFPCNHSLNNHNSKTDDPFALFTGVALALGVASQLGITDDWTVPITLATLALKEEFDQEVAVNTRPKMSWDEEDSDDNANVKESWDDSEEEEQAEEKKVEKSVETAAPTIKKKLTLKEKIAEKEAALKEQKAKKIALANRFMEGETEEERFERAQKEAGIEKAEFHEEGDAPKKTPSKPVESIKPRYRSEFEEFQKLLTNLILEQKSNPLYASFIEQLAKDIAAPALDMDVRKAASSLTALANDKQRQQKEILKNSKKTKGKVQPAKAVPAVSTREYSTTYDDFDDFM